VIFAFVIIVLLAGLVIVPWLFLFLSYGPGNAIRSVPDREFLGPGGPDDPFSVRIPRKTYDELLARQAQTRTVRVLREANDEELPRPDEQRQLPPAA
jgi:hypothetical protein